MIHNGALLVHVAGTTEVRRDDAVTWFTSHATHRADMVTWWTLAQVLEHVRTTHLCTACTHVLRARDLRTVHNFHLQLQPRHGPPLLNFSFSPNRVKS